MDYITNKDGEIQVIDEKGNHKWLPKHIAEDSFLMRGYGYSIVPKPNFVTGNEADSKIDNESQNEFSEEAQQNKSKTKPKK